MYSCSPPLAVPMEILYPGPGPRARAPAQWSSDAYFKERPKAGKLVDLIVPILYQPLLKIGTFWGASCRAADQGAFGLDKHPWTPRGPVPRPRGPRAPGSGPRPRASRPGCVGPKAPGPGPRGGEGENLQSNPLPAPVPGPGTGNRLLIEALLWHICLLFLKLLH